jgi:eukaryotic-like serine/threonine-protein kinase
VGLLQNMSSEKSQYEAHLTTLGIDPDGLRADEGGTIVARVASLRSQLRLPVLRTEDHEGDLADVRLQHLLGEGGMGKVFSAEQVALGREVAVKILREDPKEGSTDMLLREAMIAGRLEHPNVVPVYWLGRMANGEPIFVMRRIDGVPWASVLSDVSTAPGMFAGIRDPLEFHLEVFMEVCEAVQFAHSRGILHRDLKPSNVMLGAFREVYVVDWGLAVSLGDDPRLPLASQARGVVGTPAYISPEMAAADFSALSPQTDVYLLGAILHEILVGTPPHHEGSLIQRLGHAFLSTPLEYPADVPTDLVAVCRRAMRKNPAERYASADELRRAVQECMRHRNSWSLSDDATRRSHALFTMLNQPRGERDQAATVIQTQFAECRFGYRQSLAAWDGNIAAVDGFQTLLEVMVDYELSRESPQVAAELLAQMPREVPELALRVRAANEALEARTERMAALEHFHKNADVTLGATTHNRLGVFVGIVWGTASFVVAWGQRTHQWHFGYTHSIVASLLFAAMCTGFVVWLRHNTPMNDVQKRFTLILALCSVGFINHWVLCAALRVSFHAALSLYLLWAAGGWVLSAILYNRRLLAGAVALGAGALGVALFPRVMFDIFGLSAVAAYASVLLPTRWFERVV